MSSLPHTLVDRGATLHQVREGKEFAPPNGQDKNQWQSGGGGANRITDTGGGGMEEMPNNHVVEGGTSNLQSIRPIHTLT